MSGLKQPTVGEPGRFLAASIADDVGPPKLHKARQGGNAFSDMGGELSILRYRNPHALGPTRPRTWTAVRLLQYAVKHKLPDWILERCSAGTMTRRELMPMSGRKVRNK